MRDAMMTGKRASGASSCAEIKLSKWFADMLQSYMECSDDVQAAIRDMAQVMNSPEATGEERERECRSYNC